MSTYSELIKNYEKIRAYMREFYVYGFKSRYDYNTKSSRSYDNERRRIESWLGEHMNFVRTNEGKNVFISIDSRTATHNPFYKTWKAKSFTDGDITLHFIIFDVLHSPEVKLTITEIMQAIDGEYLSSFDTPTSFDESTVRKKLKEYCDLGIITIEKNDRKTYYSRTSDAIDVINLTDCLDYFSETLPCGVIGSFILDKQNDIDSPFTFKHHYMTSAIDSGVLADIFLAMSEKRAITVTNHRRGKAVPLTVRIIPLQVFISVQNGRQHVVAYTPEQNKFSSYRIDYLSDVKPQEVTPRFDELRKELDDVRKYTWVVNVNKTNRGKDRLERVEFVVKIGDDEQHIIKRLEREKRNGTITKLDDNTYEFHADMYDSREMIPWIRTFICRIVKLNFSNRTVENKFKSDLKKTYNLYGIDTEEYRDIQ